ncbi:MAG: hypothetical protein ACRESS_11655 [Stenotrophobium sp.]
MRIRRHAPHQDETGIDLAPMQRTSPFMNLLRRTDSGLAFVLDSCADDVVHGGD